MKWDIIKSTANDEVEYRLMAGEDCRVILKYNARLHSFRIKANDNQRMFFVQSTGILRSRVILKNEYGVEVGKLASSTVFSNSFTAEIEGEKYHISYRNNPLVELLVYKRDINEPIITCGLIAQGNAPSISLQSHDEISSLLLGLCWFVFLPVASENTTELLFT